MMSPLEVVITFSFPSNAKRSPSEETKERGLSGLNNVETPQMSSERQRTSRDRRATVLEVNKEEDKKN